MSYDIEHADILQWARTYSGPKFHACLCDAPYHLTEIVKRFGKEGSSPAKQGKDGAFSRLSRGFMGATWDGSDEIAFQPSTWQAIGKHLHGGAFMMVFAGTRGYHRMATAIEDAGFIIHPAIGWSFGSGFCKATRVDDQVDSAAGLLPRVVGKRKHAPKFAAAEFEYREKDNGFNSKERQTFDVTTPATDLAASWAGHRYGLQALKPAFEFLCVAQKPYDRVTCAEITAATGWDHWCVTTEIAGIETRFKVWRKWGVRLPSGHVPGRTVQVVRKALHAGAESSIEYWQYPEFGAAELVARINVRPFRPWATNNSVACMLVTQGAGALNVDRGRIGTDEDTARKPVAVEGIAPFGSGSLMGGTGSPLGRWPANLILAHNPDCEQIGIRRVKNAAGSVKNAGPRENNVYGKDDRPRGDWQAYGEDGYETIPDWTCSPGCAVARLGAQSGESESSSHTRHNLGVNNGVAMNGGNKYWKSSSPADTGTAARFFYNVDWMYERLEDADPVLYRAKASTAERDAGLDSLPTIRVDDGRQKSIDNAYQRGETGRKNPHPTVKPVSLTKHLASLLLPPDCYTERRLLIPFAGVGSEVLGALLAGWETVKGIELEAKHMFVGNLRISKWRDMAAQLRTLEPERIVQELTKPKPAPLTSAAAKVLWQQPITVRESDYTGTMFDL